MPRNDRCLNDVIYLIAESYLNRIVVSQDTCLKRFLTTYGEWGCAHILRDVVPVMRGKGIAGEQIHTLLVENPKRLLSFAFLEN